MIERVVIVGGGRVGRHVAEQLGDEQYAVTVVERNPETCEQLATIADQVVEGDGTDRDVFEEAEPAGASVVAALTDDTDVNLAVCEMAREVAPDARTLLRVAQDGEQAYGYRSFVDDVVYPAAAGATAAVNRINRI
jgi:trk system potassium uptake protein TrkA